MSTAESVPRAWRHRAAHLVALAVAYILIAIVLLGANPFRGETTGPFDLLASYPGWNPEGVEVNVRNDERSDVVDWLLPGWMESRRQLRDGNLPLWNPLQAGGRAALVDPSNAQATIGFALFASAPDPALGFYLSVLSTLVLAGLGMHLLVARYCSMWSAFFAGASYMACGFITAWLYWPQTHTAMWIPWLLLAVACFATTRSNKALAAIAATTAMMFLGGFPFVVALGLGAALVHGAVSVLPATNTERFRRLLGIVAGIALGLALVAIPLLTLVSLIDSIDMGQRNSGSGLGLAHAKLLSLPWASLKPRVESNMYVGMLALVLAPVGLALLSRRRLHPLVLTGAVLAAVGAMLTFELLPREIGSHLPVLSNNLWSRAILLLDIGILLLAACGIEFIVGRMRPRAVAAVFGIVVFVVQGVDVGHQFRKFNGATPAAYFYPGGPELDVLRATARPFQYVAQDSGHFLISGTLGAIGLGEWFAHALRSPQLGNLLDAMSEDPFTSPTTTAIPISGFHLAQEIADGSGLCYAAYAAGWSWGDVVYRPAGKTSAALPPINNAKVIQRIALAHPAEVAAAAVRLATYRATNLDGTVTLTLKSVGDDTALSAKTIPAGSVHDNQMALFHFPRALALPAGNYELELLYSPGPLDKRMTAWILTDVQGSVLHGTNPHVGVLTSALIAPEDGSMDQLAMGATTGVARSTMCADGAYWASDLTRPYASATQGKTTLLEYRPHAFSLEVSAPGAGFLVVPMQYQRGWTAEVDGRRQSLRLAHGVMPAVPVPAGTSKVALSYRPPRWRTGLAVSISALLVLAWLLLPTRERDSRKRAGSLPGPMNQDP